MTKKYKFAVIAVDVIIFTVKDGRLQTLLIKMKKRPYSDCWAAPGGLIDPRETCEKAAERVLKQKTGLKNIYPVRNRVRPGRTISNGVYLEQLRTFSAVGRDPFGRVVSVAYFALLPSSGLQLGITEEYAGVRWHPASRLPKMAYDHKEMIETAVKRLRARLGYTNIVCNLLPPLFTLTDLQKTYEVILGRKIDKRNFRKKILALGLIKKTKKQRRGLANRPAELYKFVSHKLQIVEIL
jgi:8-oxo-dGTP diphosphatase